MKQISDELFKLLCLYHLLDVRDQDIEDKIYSQLLEKLDKAVARDQYTKLLLDNRKKTEP